jgi:hypothetical protein
MSGRASAGRAVAEQVKALMDSLLVEEHRTMTTIGDGLRGMAISLTEQINAAGKTRRLLANRIPDLLPTPEQVLDVVSPPIGHLLAVTREQTIPVIRRQLRTCQQAIGRAAIPIADAAATSADNIAPDLEARYFAAACATIGAATAVTTGRMQEQARLWSLRPSEGPEQLARRWCTEDRVNLPGAPGRGIIWQLHKACASEARAASVSLVNGLLLAGYGGWNRAAAAS